MKVLIVEDEIRLAEALEQLMKQEEYDCDVVYDGEDALYYALSGIYDVIVLDVMIPKLNGFEVVKKIRENKLDTPVIMLTAKGEISDKIQGLDYGADDYMTKPFVPEELLARIRALSRRQGEVILEELTFGDLTLNISSYNLECGIKSIPLKYKEFEIMKLLMTNAKNITQKEDLITKVWGIDSHAVDNNVEVYISFLRKKLFFLNSKVVVTTIRKVGYRLDVHDA